MTNFNTIRPQRLRTTLTWTLVGNTAYAACQWALITLLARLTTPTEVGQFSLAFAITAPIFTLTNLSLRTAQVADVRGDFTFRQYATLRFLTTTLAVLCALLITFQPRYHGPLTIVIAAISLAKAAESASDIIYGQLQRHDYLSAVSKSLILRGILSLATFGFALHLTHRLSDACIVLAATWMIALLVYDIPAYKTIIRNLAPGSTLRRGPVNSLAGLVIQTLPLGLGMMLFSLNINIPRYFIERTQGVTALGIFTALAYLQAVGNTVVNAVGQASSLHLSTHFSHGDLSCYRRLVIQSLMIVCVIGGAGVITAVTIGPQLLTKLYGPQYAVANALFVWLMAAAAGSYVTSFLGYALAATRHFRGMLIWLMISSASTFVACTIFVPAYGSTGAAMAMLAGNIVQVLVGLAYLQAILRRASILTPSPFIRAPIELESECLRPL